MGGDNSAAVTSAVARSMNACASLMREKVTAFVALREYDFLFCQGVVVTRARWRWAAGKHSTLMTNSA